MAAINENGFWKHIESEANEVITEYKTIHYFFLTSKLPNISKSGETQLSDNQMSPNKSL